MAHSPGPILAAGTLTGNGTTDTVLTSTDSIVAMLNINVVTAATVTIGVTPLGGTNVTQAVKVLAAGSNLIFDGLSVGPGDKITVLSTQTDTTYGVFTSDNPNSGIRTTTSAGGTSNAGTDRIVATYYLPATLAAAVNGIFFVATRPLQVIAISEVHGVAAGGTSTLTVEKDTGTTAPGSGTSVMSGSFNLNATANTVQNATLSATAADALLAAGDRLAVKFANAIQSTTTLCVSVELLVL